MRGGPSSLCLFKSHFLFFFVFFSRHSLVKQLRVLINNNLNGKRDQGSDMETAEKENYLDIKKQLTDLGFDTFYCVKKSLWTYYQGKNGIRDRYHIENYYTPLLCFIDNTLETVNVYRDADKHHEHHVYYDVSYEILTEFSSVPIDITIIHIMSICSDATDHGYDMHKKSIMRMRDNAVKFGEEDQFKKLMLTLIDKFPCYSLVYAILNDKDQGLCEYMMQWIIQQPSFIKNEDIIPVLNDFPDHLIYDLMDHASNYYGAEFLRKLIDAVTIRSSDTILIYFLKKYDKISSSGLLGDQRTY